MDFTMKRIKRPWKPHRIHKRVKLAKFYKLLKPFKILKKIKNLFRPSLREDLPPRPLKEEALTYLTRNPDIAFMTCTIKVNPSRYGWQRSVLRVLKHFKGARFKMDQSGVVEVSGLGNPNLLLRRLGRSRKAEVLWFQFGQCSNNLFMPVAKNNPTKEKPNHNSGPFNRLPPYMGYGYPYPQPSTQVYGPRGYGYGPYLEPRVFRPFAMEN